MTLSPQRRRQILSMFTDEDWPIEGIARELGIPERAVRETLQDQGATLPYASRARRYLGLAVVAL